MVDMGLTYSVIKADTNETRTHREYFMIVAVRVSSAGTFRRYDHDDHTLRAESDTDDHVVVRD